MAGMLPGAVELQQLTSLENIVQWAGLDETVWRVVSNHLGSVPSIRVMSGMPLATIRYAFNSLRISTTSGERSLTPVEAIQVGLVWRVSRQAMGLEDIDPMADPAATPTTTGVASAGSSAKKVKTSSVLDQLDESEIELLSKAQLDEAFNNYQDITGAEPMPDAEPTPEQIAAIHAKVIVRGEAPYADFSVLTPFGRRVQKQMKARAFQLQQDGTFKALDIPGPPSFEAWTACWEVYRTCLLMLRHPDRSTSPPSSKLVATSACLDEYFKRISKLNADYPECWHLLMQAEDKVRAEMFERFRRQLSKAYIEGRLPMGITFDAKAPWTGVFVFAARNWEYWHEHVTKPAQDFLARGGKLMSADKAARVNVPFSAQEAVDNAMGHSPLGTSSGSKVSAPFEGNSRNAKRRRRERERKESEKVQLPPKKPNPVPNPPANVHPRKVNGLFVTTHDGIEICYAFSKGDGSECACEEPCKNRRAHCCQICLGAHPNSLCPQKGEGKGNKGTGKRK